MDIAATAAVVDTETVTATELLPDAMVAGEMLQVVSAGAPVQVRFTWLANGPPDELNVIG
jgi:hypothetical protein